MRAGAGEVIRKEERILLGRPLQIRVSRDDEVKEAVVVGVKQHGARVEFTGLRLQPGLFRIVMEDPLARVAVNLHAVQTHDEQTCFVAVVKIGEGGGEA